MPAAENLQFLVSEYMATGEGLTVCVLITQASPGHDLDDYEELPSFDENWAYNPGQLKTTAEQRARREFVALFGSWYALGVECLSSDDFFQRYQRYIPRAVKNIVENNEDSPGNFHYSARFHVNYS